MGARKLRIESEEVLLQRLAPPIAPPSAPPIAAADSAREAVESPAVLLQQQLDTAVAVAPWGGRPDPVIRPWAAAVRLGVLAAGAAASWAAVVFAVRFLI